MEQEFSILKTTRENIQGLMSSFSADQLVKIPENFKNNLLWNYGHVIVTQQVLCYKLAGIKMNISDDIIDKYKKGSIPSGEFNPDDLKIFNELCFRNVELLDSDYKKGLFTTYTKYQTSYGFELNSIEDAIKFNNSHEALHLGYMMALKKYL